MNRLLKLVLLHSYTFIGVILCNAQIQNSNEIQIPDAPPAMKAAIRKGDVKVYYYERSNVTSALVQSYIMGSIEGDYQGKDAIKLNVDYRGHGRPPIKSEFLDFWIQFTSQSENKFKDNHKITIYADDKVLLVEEPDFLYAKPEGRRVNVETYTIPKMTHNTLHLLSLAKKVIVQVGNTKIELPSKTLESLRDLDNTIAH